MNAVDVATTRSRRHTAAGVRLLIAGSLAFSAIFIARSSFTIRGRRAFSLFDDAMISMTYGRNLAHGHGLVWNANGPRVEGITNPLWTGLMAVVQGFGVGDRYAALPVMITGAVLLVVCGLLARAIAQRLMPGSRAVGTVAAALIVTNFALNYWTLRGMEVGLVAMLALAAILLALRISSDAANARRDALLLGAVITAGMFTRMDFAVVAIAVVAYLAVRLGPEQRRRVLGIVCGIAVAALVSQEIARHAYYGDWLPNTYTLKVAGYSAGVRLRRGVDVLSYGALEEWGVLAVVALMSAAVGGIDRRRVADRLLPCAVFASTVVYSTWVGGDAWEWMRYPNRYVVVGAAALAPSAAVGIVALASLARERQWLTPLRVAVGAACILGVAALAQPFDEGLLEMQSSPWMRGTALLAAGGIAVAVLIGKRASSVAITLIVCAGVIAATSLPAFATWDGDGGAHVRDDATASQAGAVIESITDAQAKVAVVWAGAPLYFAHRTGVDLLGKSDRRIARSKPHADLPLYPGHGKWDYAVSIGHDQPDLVFQLWQPTLRDVAYLQSIGYRPIAPRADADPDHVFVNGVMRSIGRLPMFARVGSPHVRWDQVVVLSPSELERIERGSQGS